MAQSARLDSVIRSPETLKIISKLTSDMKTTVLETARKDKNRNENKNKATEASAEESNSTAKVPIHASDDYKMPLLDTLSTINEIGTNKYPKVAFEYNTSMEVKSTPDDGIISNLPLYDTSHYCSLFLSSLRSRVEERLENLNSSNPLAEHSTLKVTSSAGTFADQNASDEILKSALTLLLKLLPQI